MTRGREYLCRVLFRPPCEVSLGTDPRAGISLPADELPPYHDLMILTVDEAILGFDSDMMIELTADGQLLKTRDILDLNLARAAGDAWRLPLPVGTKGLIHFGPVRLLFKVQRQRAGLILDTKVDGDPVCLACSQPLEHGILGGGALTPCLECGALNRLHGSLPRHAAETAVDLDAGSKDAKRPSFDAVDAFRGARVDDSGKIDRGILAVKTAPLADPLAQTATSRPAGPQKLGAAENAALAETWTAPSSEIAREMAREELGLGFAPTEPLPAVDVPGVSEVPRGPSRLSPAGEGESPSDPTAAVRDDAPPPKSTVEVGSMAPELQARMREAAAEANRRIAAQSDHRSAEGGPLGRAKTRVAEPPIHETRAFLPTMETAGQPANELSEDEDQGEPAVEGRITQLAPASEGEPADSFLFGAGGGRMADLEPARTLGGGELEPIQSRSGRALRVVGLFCGGVGILLMFYSWVLR